MARAEAHDLHKDADLWRTTTLGPAKADPRLMDQLGELLEIQEGLVARRQLLRLGHEWERVRNQVRARRWVIHTPRVIGTTTGALSWKQRCWMAVLHAGPRSLLGGLSAAEVLSLAGWHRDTITVLVDDELAFEPVEGVRFFRSRRPFELLASPRPGIPTTQLEPAILLWAGYDAPIRAAHGVLAAAVQQRLTTANRLLAWIEDLRPLRRARGFRGTVTDIEGGAHSGAELDVRRVCRRFGLRLPDRQRPRLDRSGKRRWTDCEWDFPDGSALVLEVDGSFHVDVVAWSADIKRARALTTGSRTLVRCTSFELRHEMEDVARDLVALGCLARPDEIPRRVPEPALGRGLRHTTGPSGSLSPPTPPPPTRCRRRGRATGGPRPRRAPRRGRPRCPAV
jgi:hypothetical protein